MTTAARRGQHSLKIDLPDSPSYESPPIAAIFVIYFDQKAGYTLGWRRSISGVDLEGVVEFKSLPSGLHKVQEDLIYFVDKQYAGVSAFINEPASESERNASMLAVGVLVPLSFGRLGRSWRHAQAVKEFSKQLVPDVTNTAILEEYWELYRVNEQESPAQSNSPMDSPLSLKFMPARQRSNGESGQARTRAVSDMGALNPSEQNLSPHHPALSLMNLVDTFGPLVFPLQRAALLRKRILLVTHAPIQLACDFVYNLSILSTLPLAVNDLLSSTSPASRLRPFFSIGVHDIPMLVKEAMAAETGPLSPSSTSDGYLEDVGGGWVACTTDEILAVKHDLYDVLVTLPPAHSQDAKDKIWPTIECPKGTEVKATQRDLRRYRTLRQGLSRYRDPYSDESEDNDTTSINSRAALVADQDSETSMEEGYTPVDDSRIIEAQSWASLAYSSFMWWASAGEARQDTIEEEERDASLFDHPFGPDSTPPGRPRSRSSITTFSKGSGSAKPEMALIAYFHRLTCAVLRTLGDLVDAIDGDDNPPDDETEAPVFVSSEDLTAMGLDVWSESDRAFVEEALGIYFGRKAEVQGGRVECCGVQVMEG